ncbi:hypothetical protein SAMN06297144_3259 [Sphingomonas guangdongensis]|uniref:Uncharacterized protein n=1 Tax=Sphingomonas guangdongensis TaxID=1141890 RepID=A0A285R319_9SPHN|nr:hypothetical protein SAMN06297144_3259 [Sphingomonas guangdongensis]
MGTRTVPPLTKQKPDGTIYSRRADVEGSLERLVELPRSEVIAALKIRDARSDLYVQSECVVHLIRAARNDNDQSYFAELYRELMRRIGAVLPRVEGERSGLVENVHAADARDRVRDLFNERLSVDRTQSGSALDYFEVMFADAIAALRKTAMKRATRQAARSERIEADDETNEPSLAVEKAVGSLDLKQELLSEDPIYRSRVVAAIQALPDKQRRVIEMILQEMPIDSSDEGVLSIRKAIGVSSEKTVRNRRDAAFASIRKALEIGSDHD